MTKEWSSLFESMNNKISNKETFDEGKELLFKLRKELYDVVIKLFMN